MPEDWVQSIDLEIKKHWLRWLEHVLRMSPETITKVALRPPGEGRLKLHRQLRKTRPGRKEKLLLPHARLGAIWTNDGDDAHEPKFLCIFCDYVFRIFSYLFPFLFLGLFTPATFCVSYSFWLS